MVHKAWPEKLEQNRQRDSQESCPDLESDGKGLVSILVISGSY